MSTNSPRPRGVLVAAILLILAGAFSVITGIMGLISVIPGATSGEQALAGPLIVYTSVIIVIGVLNILLAVGILRGNRAARLLVTILQVATVAIGLIGLSSSEASHDIARYVFSAIVTPLAIVLMLWLGAQTKAFFARKS